MHQAIIPIFGAFEAWRDQARAFALSAVKPGDIQWSRPNGSATLFNELPRDLASSAGTLTVPRDFLSLAAEVVCSADASAFSLLYCVLLRLQDDTHLLANPADIDVHALNKISKEIHRDCHKMKAFVRFNDVGEDESGRRQFAAWFEPDNFIVERASGFFARRFADMDWTIATPKGTATFVGGHVTFSQDDAPAAKVTDEMDDLWRAYYASIFNPARLKIKSMQGHMPKKYWKNLPEAALIPELIAGAEVRTHAMREHLPSDPHRNLRKIKAPAAAMLSTDETFASYSAAKEAAKHCQRCPLFANATQTVFGEGNLEAELMFVGEQPGDQEDLAGRPFVGPAGKIFDAAMEAAGLDRQKAYITNAVKHFKFTPHGKRRIHQKPVAGEIRACNVWLKHEMDFIRPKTLVAMGATALQALTGNGAGILKRRGQFEQLPDGTRLLITYHPSALLRAPDPDIAARMRSEFFADIALLAKT